MEDFYANSTSQNKSYNYSNFIVDTQYVVTCMIIALGLPSTLMAIYALFYMLCYMIVEVAERWDSKIYEIFYVFVYHFGMMASVGFMVCISLERYLVIVHPLWYRYRRTIKTSVEVCVVVWVLPLICVIPYYFWDKYVVTDIILAVFLLLPFPLLIFFLVGTLRALSASIALPSKEKRRIVGILVLVLLIYMVLFLPNIIWFLGSRFNETLNTLSFTFAKLSPLADLVLYVFMRKGAIDKFLASVCCCRMDSNEISISSV
ncbi:mas-related G-protein coupled receptor member A4-like isoform X2 [Micropterus salmoides]|uniref:mas-related G-protein coupled receptor member A4-like isoform X2 n=1 Tax=Micropterus salmoides TaxID=27706 RepID=UPI0018EC94F5|nr:mas-related G-protein coupled receptor member A4-like isoform X2 [Micropterus salmoides]XP_038588698.1 mas-related G-protein coupled receptor member A4-like isoform X2 [Micropterus salmoides]